MFLGAIFHLGWEKQLLLCMSTKVMVLKVKIKLQLGLNIAQIWGYYHQPLEKDCESHCL